MTVYVDRAANGFGRMVMSHMLADTPEELHAMADAIGVKRKWFQATASSPHYDVCQTKRILAVRLGAAEIDRSQLYAVIKAIRVSEVWRAHLTEMQAGRLP